MKHIKNSINGSIYLLEHAGVPVALSTDFSESIKNGSLCVDTTNQDLYILRNNVWVKMGAGFNTDDWIPRRGTDVNKPVYGDIEIQDGIKFYSGQSGINFADAQLGIEYSDNDLNTSINNNLTLNRNVLFQRSDVVSSFDSASTNNFVNKITNNTAPGVIFNNSANNIINSNIAFPTTFTNVNYTKLSGNIGNLADFGYTYNSDINVNSIPRINIGNLSNSNIGISIDQTQTFSLISNSYTNLRSRIYGNNSVIQQNTHNYVEGTIKNTNYYNNNFVNSQGHFSDVVFTFNNYVYNLGHITGNEAGILTGSASTTSIITQSTQVYNLGSLGYVNLNNLNNVTLLGKNTSIKAQTVSDDVLINNNGYQLTGNSNKNLLFNNENKTFTSTRKYSKLESSQYNLLFNNNQIYSTSGNFNLIVNTDNIKLYGSNNLVFTPKDFTGGFTGKIYGRNNVIFSLKQNKNYAIDSNVFTFGDINSTSGIHIKNGNILMGSIDINPTLSTNNQIFAAKRLKNIDHAGQINNIFLNVDEFIVPDSNTVYLPQKFYGINLGNYGLFNLSNISGDQYWNFPDKSGTVALVGDISTGYLTDLLDVTINNVQEGDVLTYNAASTSWINQANGGGSSAYNGLTNSSSGIKLGGTLSENTNINVNSNPFTISNGNLIVNFTNRELITDAGTVLDWQYNLLRDGINTSIDWFDRTLNSTTGVAIANWKAEHLNMNSDISFATASGYKITGKSQVTPSLGNLTFNNSINLAGYGASANGILIRSEVASDTGRYTNFKISPSQNELFTTNSIGNSLFTNYPNYVEISASNYTDGNTRITMGSNLTSIQSSNNSSLSNYYFYHDGFAIHTQNAYGAILANNLISGSDKTFQFPNQSGTLALTSDIASASIYGSNGLTKNGNTIKLGGNLNETTYINGNDFNFNILGANSMYNSVSNIWQTQLNYNGYINKLELGTTYANYLLSYNGNGDSTQAWSSGIAQQYGDVHIYGNRTTAGDGTKSSLIMKVGGINITTNGTNGIGFSTNGGTSNKVYFKTPILLNDININTPAQSGTLALTSDIFVEGTTGALKAPVGSTAQQPSSPVAGMIRFNTDINKGEMYDGTVWQPLW